MKEIKLTRGKVALVDDADFEILSKYKWSAIKGRNTYYASRQERSSNGRQKSIKMHRQILGTTSSEIHIDHRDGDGLNNQRTNLRECTHAQNKQNALGHSGASSKYKGVTYMKDSGKWIARISVNKNTYYLGVFKSEVDAAKARDGMAIKLHGEFAKLNQL